MTSLAAIVYSSDNVNWTQLALAHLRDSSSAAEIVLIDNGSTPPYGDVLPERLYDRLIRYDENVGGNAVFHRWAKDGWWETPPDIMAFLHCDLMVYERGWDERAAGAFAADPALALVGFVGSSQIDERGGRGTGTMLNFRGSFYDGYGSASAAEVHGRRMRGLEPAAVVDHCSMVFRRSVLEGLTPQEGHYAPEHFYDRLLSCEVIEKGHRVAVMGVDCDHFSGGIGDGMAKADALRRAWLDAEGVAYDPADTYGAVYRESERRFFERYRGFFPFRVGRDWSVEHR